MNFDRTVWNIAGPSSNARRTMFAGLVVSICYALARVAQALTIPPDHVSLFWPTTSLLVALLVLSPRRTWLTLVSAGLVGTALGDLQVGVPPASIVRFVFADAVAVLVAMFIIERLLPGLPSLTTLKTFGKFTLATVIFAAPASAIFGANATASRQYWLQWSLWSFSNALAFVTVVPAILTWVREGREWAKKPRNHFELAALLSLVVLIGWFIFMRSERLESAALVYLLVPVLLWATLRLGLKGISLSLVLVSFFSIWGGSHGRGPFMEHGSSVSVLSLQLFLLFAAAPFIALALIVEEHKRDRRALISRDNQLSEAQRLAQIGVWWWDPKTDTVTWSDELYRIAGRDPRLPTPSYREHSKFFTPESWERLQQAVEKTLRTGDAYKLDLEMVWPDGTTRWLRARGEAQWDANGRIAYLRGTVKDITERKRAEEALRESEERLRLALQVGKMYAFDWDVATDAVVRSDAATHIHGLKGEPTKLSHQQLLVRVHPEDRATFVRSIAVLTPESPDTEICYRLLRPDGSVVWMQRTGHAFFDDQGKMVRMIGMVADTTERKLAENKLQEYERAVEGVEEMIVVIDQEYRYLIANNKFLKMRNMTKEQVVGHCVPEVLNEEVFEAVVKGKMDECFQGKVVRYEMKYTYPKLGERDILISYFPIEGPAGVDRVACIVHDITERKLAEQVLSTVSQRLIEAQEQERSRLARELHDDINQRLALLVVTLNALKHRVPAESIELRQTIEEASQQISDVGADVQALSHRLHSSKLEYLGLEKAASGFCREFSDQQGVEIDFQSNNLFRQELSQEVSLCLFRVLQEALQNAAKHSGSRHFKVSLKRQANEIELTVHDSGIGFQLDQAIKGRGLGLTSMQERLKLVEGNLSIESQLEEGTTVRACVPLQLRSAVAAVGEYWAPKT